MPNFLSKKIDSAAQLEAAQRKQARPRTKREEDEAKRSGFKSAAEMEAYARQKAQRSGGTTAKPRGSMMDNALSWHPKKLLEHVNTKMRDAMSRPKKR
jgi:hypothetical protein